MLLYFCSKIYVFAPQNYGAIQTLPRKVMEQCRLRPAKSQSLRSFPRKITETLFFGPQNYGAMQTLLCKIAKKLPSMPLKSVKLHEKTYFFLLKQHKEGRAFYQAPLVVQSYFIPGLVLQELNWILLPSFNSGPLKHWNYLGGYGIIFTFVRGEQVPGGPSHGLAVHLD